MKKQTDNNEKINYPLSSSDAITLSVMIITGLIDYRYFAFWTDEIIAKTTCPESWLIELSTTQYSPNAAAILEQYAKVEGHEESLTDIFVACQYLRYFRNEIAWATFLYECGQESDFSDGRIECEYFYCMLTELENADYADDIVKSQSLVVAQEYSDELAKVRKIYLSLRPYLENFRQFHNQN